MTQEEGAFFRFNDLLVNSTQVVIMNEEDPILLYTDASAKAIDRVHM